MSLIESERALIRIPSMAGIVDFDETVRCTFMQAFESFALSQTIFMILPPFFKKCKNKKIVVVVDGVEKRKTPLPLYFKGIRGFWKCWGGV